MKNIPNILKTKVVPVISSLILFASVPALYAWTAPTATPPAGNVAAPVNVGSISQNKAGVLGLGGLGVFGSALITPVGGYNLPSSLNLGVNGRIGAKEYCDQNGNNCVTTFGGAGGGLVSGTSSTNGILTSQIFSGWPNGIVCNATNGTKIVLRVSGYYPTGRDRYSTKPGYIYGEIGGIVSIYFDATSKKSLIVHGNGDYGGNLPQAFAGCFDLGRTISDPIFTWI